MNITSENKMIGQGVDGRDICIEVLRIQGQDPKAPKAYLQASLHGAELQGNAVIFHVLDALQKTPPLGEVIIVPHANPIGGNHKVGEYTQGRFDPITGENWNRAYFYDDSWIAEFVAAHQDQTDVSLFDAFRQRLITQLTTRLAGPTWQVSRAQRMTWTLQSLAHEADCVLDLHTGSVATDYLYAPYYAQAAAQYFHQSHILLMPNGFGGALDEATFCPWWTLVEHLQQQGRNVTCPVDSFTVELGSQEVMDFAHAEFQAYGILSYLSHKGVLPADHYLPEAIERHECDIADYAIFYAPYGGLYEWFIEPGEGFVKGQTIAHCLQGAQEIRAIQAPYDGRLITRFASSAVPQGAELARFFSS